MVLGVVCRRHLDTLFEAACAVDAARAIVHWNPAAEKLTGYSAAEVLGTRCSDGILVHVDEKGRRLCRNSCPACRAMDMLAWQESVVYLKHKLGYRIRVQLRSVPVELDGAAVGVIEYFDEYLNSFVLRKRLEALEKLAMLDHLTGVGNRRHAQNVLSSSRASLVRYGWGFGVAMLDVDGFKEVNDRLGHEAGDRVLRVVAGSMLSTLRPSDTLCRWGGDEFLVILPGASGPDLVAACERFRSIVGASDPGLEGAGLAISISAGATAAVPGEAVRETVARADTLLYEAKRVGGNTFRVG